ERVEVLKDGASAIYGSDAIAGVINFILRKDYTGAEVNVFYGDTEHGGGKSQKYTAIGGYGDLAKDRFNVTIVGTYKKDDALFGRQRKFASSGINVGANNDTTSGNTFPANFIAADGSFGTRNPLAPDHCEPSVVSPFFPSTRCRFDPSSLVSLLPQIEAGSVFGSARYMFTPDIEGYVEASYTQNRKNYVIQPGPISDQFALPPNHPLFNVSPYNGAPYPDLLPHGANTIILRPTSPYYPTSYVRGITGGPTPDLIVRYRSVTVGNRD